MRWVLFLSFLCSLGLSAFAQDSTALYRIGSVSFEGNKVSKPSILYREMTLNSGDRVTRSELVAKLDRSKNNLRNLNIFNFVETDTCITDTVVDVVVRLVERWYIIPEPILSYADRNLGEWMSTGWKLDRLDYGLLVRWKNFRGRNETLILTAKFGYNNTFGFKYKFPYVGPNRKLGLNLKFSFTRNHEVSYAAVDNKRIFFRDHDQYSQVQYHGSAELVFRPQLYNRHGFGLKYTDAVVTDTIAQLNPDYFNPGNTGSRFFSISYTIKHDKRDYNVYPLSGHIFESSIRKDGLGLFNTSVNMLEIQAKYSRFWKLQPRWYLAMGLKLKASPLPKQAYYAQRGLGYNTDFVRGYELYIIDGQYYGLFKSTLRFEAMPSKVLNLKFIGSDKFGLIPITIYTNVHFDAGYVADRIFENGNPLANRFIAGGGLGLDLVTYYDVVWRLEYSLNDRVEHGFFIHFTKHI